MEQTSKIERIRELAALLNKAGKAYYSESREIMSNYEYDRLYDELAGLEEETGFVMAGSPTRNVGYEVLSELPKERHPEPMLSLDKTKDAAVLKAWLKDQKGLLSWKMDGLTIVLTYENGELVKAVTRGNGEVGEVITNNAKVFVNLPVTIPYKGRLVLRGEAVITYSDFARINEEIEEESLKYKNPRNLCSGSVRQLNNEITAKRNVNFFAFALVSAEEVDFRNSRKAQFDWLAEQGFTVVEHKIVTADDIEETVEWFAGQIAANDFPSDGLVITYDDIAYGLSLGRTAKFPRNSFAFKWKDETAQTVLKEIEWSPSRTGLINPVAIFEPVELEGTTVSRASVHNVSILEELALGVGDEITVYKANMIIPQIADNLTRSGNIKIPDTCPVCGEKTQIKQQNDVKALYCVNEKCQAKHVKGFTHFVSRDAMNMDGLSEATLEKFIQMGFVKEFADLFHLDRYKDEIISMEGFGEKSYERLVSSIEDARKATLAKVIYSLGIANIGLSNAKLICRHFENDIEKIMHAAPEEVVCIDGIGEVIAESLTEYFRDEENVRCFRDLLKEVELLQENVSSGGKLDGLTFVITGSVEHFANRNELKAYIEQNGGKTTGSVTSKTDYLINNDVTSASSKNKKAAELGVKVISEEEFLKLAQ
ncbi:MAG: NAD-dependent DNA ligase LigA [Alistipes sp.]|nr:NAD-dependent DNA ligase LigA [Alistipes sp.]